MRCFSKLWLSFLLASLCLGYATAQDPGGWDMRVCADPNNLPYSNRAQEGFENKIAEILADELGANLSYVWYPARQLQIREVFREGECDVLIGLQEGSSLAATTLAYYQSTYVFIYKKDAPFELTSLDDPDLKKLRIGVQVPPGDGTGLPPTEAMVQNGLVQNFVGFSLAGDYATGAPHSAVVDAVAKGEVDVSVAWGPIGGYFAAKEGVPLKVVPVKPQVVVQPIFLPMVASISVATRTGDDDFVDVLNRALIARWEEIQQVLKDYHVPLVPLTKPKL